MKLFSRILSFVFGGVSVADHHRDMSGARTESQEEKLDLVLQRLSKLANHIDREEERNEELTDRLTTITARADALEKLVQELLAERNQPVEEPEPVAATLETLVEEAMPVATEPEPETVPAEPPTPTVEPTTVEEAVTASTAVVEVTAEKPPTVPKTEDVVKQWFTTDKEGVRWHVDQIGRRVRLIPQQDGSCSFPGCPEKKSGAHLDMRDGHGHLPVCGYGRTAAINFKRARRRTGEPRIQYKANDAELELYKKELAEAIASGEVQRLADQMIAKQRAEIAAAAVEQERRDNLHHMEVLVLGDKFEVKEGELCAVPNCVAPAPTWHLYPGRDAEKLRLLCNDHGNVAEALRKEQYAKPFELRLHFWAFYNRQTEKNIISEQTHRRADDEAVRRDHAERDQARRDMAKMRPQQIAEQATLRETKDQARGRQSHTRIKAVPAKEDKKPGDPQVAA